MKSSLTSWKRGCMRSYEIIKRSWKRGCMWGLDEEMIPGHGKQNVWGLDDEMILGKEVVWRLDDKMIRCEGVFWGWDDDRWNDLWQRGCMEIGWTDLWRRSCERINDEMIPGTWQKSCNLVRWWGCVRIRCGNDSWNPCSWWNDLWRRSCMRWNSEMIPGKELEVLSGYETMIWSVIWLVARSAIATIKWWNDPWHLAKKLYEHAEEIIYGKDVVRGSCDAMIRGEEVVWQLEFRRSNRKWEDDMIKRSLVKRLRWWNDPWQRSCLKSTK